MAMDTREKFTKWADASGVNPFLAPQRAARTNLLGRVLRVALRSLVFVLKAPLLLALLLAMALLQLLLTPPVMLLVAVGVAVAPEEALGEHQQTIVAALAGYGLLLCLPLAALMPLKRFPAQLMRGTLLRALFVVLGLNYQEEHAGLRQLGLPLPKDRSMLQKLGRPGCTVRAGDIILANHTCVLDVLYLARRFGAAFPLLHYAPEAGVYLMQPPLTLVGLGCNLFGAARRALFFASEAPTGEAGLEGVEALAAWGRARGVPVVLFPEQERTNATGVLTWADIASRPGSPADPKDVPRVHLFTFGYDEKIGESFAHPSGSVGPYLFWLCSRLTGSVKVTVLSAEYVPAFPSRQEAGVRGKAEKPSQWLEKCRDLCAKMLGATKVRLGVSDAVSFRAYLAALAAGDQDKAKELAEKRKKL